MKAVCGALLISCLTVGCEIGKTTPVVSDVSSNTEQGLYQAKLPFRLYPPVAKVSDKAPLLIYLHGNGLQGDDLRWKYWETWPPATNSVIRDVQNHHTCFILQPRCRAQQKWTRADWRKGSQAQEESTESMALLIQLIDDLLKDPRIDRGRVYLVGFSMGGYGTWDLLCRRPDIFAAAIAISGGGDPSLGIKISRIPVLAIHGDSDSIVPIQASIDMITALKQGGSSNASIQILPNVSHELTEKKALANLKTFDWLFDQHKPSTSVPPEFSTP